VVDPGTFVSGAGALKAVFDSVRSAIGMLKDVRSLGGGSEQQQQAIDNALATASSSAHGRLLPQDRSTNRKKDGDPVYECPTCLFNNAGPFAYTRTAPKRDRS
jgi:hypothetical protein